MDKDVGLLRSYWGGETTPGVLKSLIGASNLYQKHKCHYPTCIDMWQVLDVFVDWVLLDLPIKVFIKLVPLHWPEVLKIIDKGPDFYIMNKDFLDNEPAFRDKNIVLFKIHLEMAIVKYRRRIEADNSCARQDI